MSERLYNRIVVWSVVLIAMWYLTPETYGLANEYSYMMPAISGGVNGLILCYLVIWLLMVVGKVREETVKNILTLTGEYSLDIYLLQEPVIFRLLFYSKTVMGKFLSVLCGVAICLLLTKLYKIFILKCRKNRL